MTWASRFIRLSFYVFAISLFAYALSRLFLPSPVSAGWVDEGYAQAFKDCAQNNGVNSFCYTSHVEVGSMLNLVRLIIGPVRGVTITMNETDQNYIAQMYQGSGIAAISGGMAYLINNPPADLALWIQDTGQTLGFIPRQAHAQGIGFSGLTPILLIWKGFRNIAYVLVALLMVVIGFMVMLRRKIDPKTVVTVQNSLPRIVVVLLLITFSYAIVGLLIDLMYVTIGVGIALLDAGIPGGAKVTLFGLTADFIKGGFITLLGSIFAPVINNTSSFIIPLSGSNIGPINLGLVLAIATAGTSVVTGVVLTVLIALFYLFAFLRILLMLLMAYVNIILSVLVGPIQILVDVLPGNNAFVAWLKNLVVNLIPFPVTIFMLILGNALSTSLGTNSLWTPPLLPQWSLSSGFATTILWLGIVLSIPSIVSNIKEAIKAKAVLPVVGPAAGIGLAATVGRLGFEEIMRYRQTRMLQESLVERGKPISKEGKESKT